MQDMRKGRCALCNHPEVIDAPAYEYTGEEEPQRLAVTHSPEELRFFSKASGERPMGLLRMLVCRSCGFVQWFASRPERIPIDEAHGTTLLTPRD